MTEQEKDRCVYLVRFILNDTDALLKVLNQEGPPVRVNNVPIGEEADVWKGTVLKYHWMCMTALQGTDGSS